MKMQHRPLQSLHLSDTGDGGGGERLEKKKGPAEEESPLIKLGLGICEKQNRPSIKDRDPVPVLNHAQWFEFQQQSLIFQYMRAGLPVPLQLVIPIWKSIASSFGSDSSSIFKQYPSFVGFNPHEFDYKNTMDPEPGRCRRTDGKKWRCSKKVVPDQKYCEGHMHRGRQRSRKLVEASQIASPSCKASAKVAENLKTISSYDPHPESAEPLASTQSSDLRNSKAISTLFQFMTPSSNTNTRLDITSTTRSGINGDRTDVMFFGRSNSKSVVGGSVDSGNSNSTAANTATAATTSIPSLSSTPSKSRIITASSTDGKNDVSGSKKSIFNIAIFPDTAASNTGMPTNNPITFYRPNTGTRVTTTDTATATGTATSSSNNNCSSIDGKHGSINCTSTKNMINISRKSVSGTNTGGSNPSSGLDFSPKSVLQVLGSRGIELAPGRCRRTDGKKWRCSREVVPDQKYCGRHMHRGKKRRVEVSQPVAATTATVSGCRPSTMNISKREDSATLNTNLSISIPARPPVANDEEKSPTSSSSSSSSSDATISDTTITA